MNTHNIIPLVTCVNMYSYLTVSLHHNRNFFKHYYVLTSSTDSKTIELCKQNNVNVIEYDNFYIKGAKFNKSGGIEFAQKKLHELYPSSWILLLDVDVIIIDECIDKINEMDLNKSYLYSVKRYDVWNSKELDNKEKKRLYTYDFAGYFQLYYNKNMYYPEFSENASWCDILFLRKFNTRCKIDSYIFHMGKEGSHWNGKTVDW
jgi:hypothetical protein